MTKNLFLTLAIVMAMITMAEAEEVKVLWVTAEKAVVISSEGDIVREIPGTDFYFYAAKVANEQKPSTITCQYTEENGEKKTLFGPFSIQLFDDNGDYLGEHYGSCLRDGVIKKCCFGIEEEVCWYIESDFTERYIDRYGYGLIGVKIEESIHNIERGVGG